MQKACDGQGSFPLVPEQYTRDLTANILCGFWNLTLEGLVDTIGQGRTSERLRPHMEHSGHGAYRFLISRMGWKEENLERVGKMNGMAHLLLRKSVRSVRVKGEEDMVVEFNECPFEGSPSECCVCLCYYLIRGVAAEYGMDYEGDLLSTKKNGDPFCAKRVFNTKMSPSDAPWREVECDIDFMSQEEKDFFFNSYLVELWFNCIKAFNDQRDEKGTMGILSPRMRAFGMSVGLGVANDLGLAPCRGTALNVLELVQRSMLQESSLQNGPDAMVTFTSCPFSSSPNPACDLYGSFLGGVVLALYPEGEFVYRPDRDGKSIMCSSRLI